MKTIGQLERNTLVAGFDELFKSVELKLPCVIAVRNFDVHRVVKQLALAMGIKYKFWMHRDGDSPVTRYYTILHSAPISGTDIARLIYEFEHRE